MNYFYIFLDFDGVTHPEKIQTTDDNWFSRAELLLPVIEQYSHVKIIISSSWRESFSLTQIKDFFPEKIAERIIDVTPVHKEDAYQGPGLRMGEIVDWLSKNKPVTPLHWVAIDDNPWLFGTSDNEPPAQAIFTNPQVGINKETIETLRHHIERALLPATQNKKNIS